MQSWEGAWRRFSPIKRPILDFCHFVGLVGEPFSILGEDSEVRLVGTEVRDICSEVENIGRIALEALVYRGSCPRNTHF